MLTIIEEPNVAAFIDLEDFGEFKIKIASDPVGNSTKLPNGDYVTKLDYLSSDNQPATLIFTFKLNPNEVNITEVKHSTDTMGIVLL
ncbi:MAG: hypothetical protein QM537_06480 [Candidatus Symbiobacter sp.]|nr:hypothetical protein [Candidatus Symbiobacter sp.]